MGYGKIRTEYDILKLFDKTKKQTNNFKDISKDLISSQPNILLILRLAFGMPQNRFSEIIGIKRSALAHYELGNRKNIQEETADRISKKIKTIRNSLDFSRSKIRENYKIFWYQAEHGQSPEKLRNFGRSAFKTRSPNKDEKKVSDILDKNNVKYIREGVLNFFNTSFFFDFVLPDVKNPKLVIECKRISTTKNRNFRIISYKIAYEIGYKFRLLKEKYPNIVTVFLLESEIQKIPERVLKIIKNETDYFFINPKRKDFKNLLRNESPTIRLKSALKYGITPRNWE